MYQIEYHVVALMFNMDKCGGGRTPLLTLPTELLVYIMSFLTAVRDKVKLRYVSQKLRNVSDIPSLWREFAWPYYRDGDDGCVNNVLKVCGQHLKRLSFRPPSRDTIKTNEDVRTLQQCVRTSSAKDRREP